jgi:type II restriction/modification system DNA methylase subunit YeeA
LEEENNRIFIEAYALQDELSPDVPIEQITLSVNPKYRYSINYSDQELENRFQSDTIAELISYALGCVMGRYRIDKPGLIYAHSGNQNFWEIYDSVDESSTNHYSLTPNPYPPDDDGIVPLTDLEWFDDDATYRFKEFINTVFRDQELGISENRNQFSVPVSSTNPYPLTPNPFLEENLQFVAESLTLHAIKPKKDESSLETIRRYFSTGFFKQHLKTYKKRPIYWLFSSGKQKAFEALVYLHRYNESTLARMRTEYVTPLMGKYEARSDSLQQQLETASGTEVRRIEKELKLLNNKQTELRTFDDKLKHYADMRIKLDLDDGVKVNYGRFGDLLAEVKAITGKKPETMN